MRPSPAAMAATGLALIGLAIAAWLILPAQAVGAPTAAEDCALAQAFEAEAPSLELEALLGGHVTLDGLRGGVVLLNTWATWCPPCRDELPALEAVSRRHAGQGLTIIGVNVGESRQTVQRFIDRSGVTFPVWLDPDEASLRAFGTVSLPSSFLIDAQGIIRARWFGATCERELEAAITPWLEP
jgi:thiol-disulfide isomerase/thioredoxin